MQCNNLGELSKLHQDGTVYDYQLRFEQLAAQATSLTNEHEIRIFISRLKEQIAKEIELQHPPYLIGSMRLARHYRRRIRIFHESPKQQRAANSSKPPFVKRLSRCIIAAINVKNYFGWKNQRCWLLGRRPWKQWCLWPFGSQLSCLWVRMFVRRELMYGSSSPTKRDFSMLHSVFLPLWCCEI